VKPKVLSEQALIGQLGVNLIERIVLAMGSRWVPSPVLDVGIDGVIELADPTSHAALGIRVLYEIRDQDLLVLVIAIGHRRDIYR
jgi:hypothetical protein